MEFRVIFYIILLIFFESCVSEKNEGTSEININQSIDTIVEKVELAVVDTMISEGNYSDSVISINDSVFHEDLTLTHATKIRYNNFSVIFHGFGSSAIQNSKGEDVHIPSGYIESEYNIESGNTEYKESLILEIDTVFLSEDLDERINNTLIQIIPKNKNDRFVISMGYLTSLNEIIDYRNHSREGVDYFYNNSKAIGEKTKFILINDSANYFFRALPHTADMEEVIVIDGKVVPVKKRNTQKQIRDEKRFYQDEIRRIKSKYRLKDTLVVIPREYDLVATLTKNKKLFGYNFDSFLFRVDRYQGKNIFETKYILVWISYGC
ncbi:MAG: hypothetical protein J7604_18640 [Sporocytophaga sp.]|uniref:hypothetical protein n=1 Tax=Sporocytophaga sp. TaxID=2231183 RepID=UPI001B0D508A|nr:hypothetical protein [Sporocytophaga sp.]MBO9702234.1 hypothetical protein [Sporocytophaga sp.]